MDANQLKGLVQFFEENKKFINNEEATKMALVIPFIRLLGYDPGLPREVRPEFCADFTQGDGKKFPDRMDYAIFDSSGEKARMVFETKPLGWDITQKSPQLARYIGQMPGLHFGIITDGCNYQFYGDLEKPNVMDKEPFFAFALNDPKTDWEKVAKFLTKFSRESFKADTLVIDAENSRYRQAMIDKLAKALKSPSEDAAFMEWLTAGVMKGNRTAAVMARLSEIARDSIEPTLLRVMSNDFIERLRVGLQRTLENGKDQTVNSIPQKTDAAAKTDVKPKTESKVEPTPPTPDEKPEFYRIVREICVTSGAGAEEILGKDTTYYFNVSHKKPTFWFARFFADSKRKNITTLVPVEEAKLLAKGFEIEPSPEAFGVSRIYITGAAQLWELKLLLARSLAILQAEKAGPGSVGASKASK
jgi:predicted type IV restriction endonuclease